MNRASLLPCVAAIVLLAIPAWAQDPVPVPSVSPPVENCTYTFYRDLQTPPRDDVPAGEFTIFVARSTLYDYFPNLDRWGGAGCKLQLLDIQGAHGRLLVKLVPTDIQYPSAAFAAEPEPTAAPQSAGDVIYVGTATPVPTVTPAPTPTLEPRCEESGPLVRCRAVQDPAAVLNQRLTAVEQRPQIDPQALANAINGLDARLKAIEAKDAKKK